MAERVVFSLPLHRVRRGNRALFISRRGDGMRTPARVARMLALAHRLERAIREGAIKDQREVAKQLKCTPALVSQLFDLLRLAPDLQEAVLFLEAVDGEEPITCHALRDVTAVREWTKQRTLFHELLVERDDANRGRQD